jgi:membrane-bound ClpP family serine protease
MRKERIKATILASIDEIVIIIAIFFILPLFGINIPLWITILIIIVLTVLSIIVYKALYVLEKEPIFSKESIIGKEGKALTDINDTGVVLVENETWLASSAKGVIKKGKNVRVIKIEGNKLIVEEV